MEGRPDPGVKNYLRDKFSLHQRLENRDVIQGLLDHPALTLLDQIVDDALERSERAVNKARDNAALSTDPALVTDYATKRGVHSGLSFHRDVIASVLDSAKTAEDELKKTAALDEAAERSQ